MFQDCWGPRTQPRDQTCWLAKACNYFSLSLSVMRDRVTQDHPGDHCPFTSVNVRWIVIYCLYNALEVHIFVSTQFLNVVYLQGSEH